MSKKKVLIASEYSQLNTGYGVYVKGLMEELAKSDKYELAEHSSYCGLTDMKNGQEVLNQEALNLPWFVYPNLPYGKEETDLYRSDGRNAHGKWRFDRVCLDFKPDFVLTLRDFWMDEHVHNSHYRPYFNLACLAPIDSKPQHLSWIEAFMKADGVFTFTDWGKEVLDEEGGGLINTLGGTGIVANPDFKPIDKQEIKKEFGLHKDSIIIGTVMRNQKRKLYPDLFESFAEVLKVVPKNIADNLYLLTYCCYPDLGWEIPQLINELGIAHKVVFVYICKTCGHIFPSLFKDARTVCEKCNNYTAIMPSTNAGAGLTTAQIAKIYNLMDIYVQWANCEGFGIPLTEAGGCALPIVAINYSAMTEVTERLGGYLIDPLTIQKETETTAFRAIPDNPKLVELLVRLVQQPKELLQKRGLKSLEGVKKYYSSWADLANQWMTYIDNTKLKGTQGKWESAPRFCELKQPPQLTTNDQIVRWCILSILNEPELLFSRKHIDWVSSLNLGAQIKHDLCGLEGLKFENFSREDFLKFVQNYANDKNLLEEYRVGLRQLQKPAFVEFHNKK